MNIGYIPLHRQKFDNWLWKEARQLSKFEAYLFLCQRAAYRPHVQMIDGKPISLGYGQLVASQRFLQNAFSWRSKTKVETFLKNLQEMGEIEATLVKNISLITVCELESYYSTKANEKPTRSQREANEKPTRSQREAKGEESKERKEDKKREEGELITASFDNFELIKTIGKDAARIWTEIDGKKVFNGKSEFVLKYLKYRCEKQRPLQAHAEMTALWRLTNAHSVDRLEAMFRYSAEKGYPALYPDFDKNKKGINGDGFPDNWDAKYFRSLNTDQHAAYYKHLREKGLKVQKHPNGEIKDWVPI